jgi:superfamily II DNA or RNA helicase
MELTDYQVKMLEEAKEFLRQGKKPVIVAPTGAGKTATICEMLRRSLTKQKTSWFVIHKRELMKQTSRAYTAAGIPHDIISGGRTDGENLAKIATVQTLARREPELPDLVVIDEAHNSAAKSFDHTFKGKFTIGLSGSPERTDGRGLGSRFDAMVLAPSTKELTRMGYLSPYKYFAPSNLDLSKAKKVAGEYTEQSLDDAFAKSTIVGDAVKNYKEKVYGKKTLVFCYSIKHAEETCAVFAATGIPSAFMHSGMNDAQLDKVLQDFATGKIWCLMSVGLAFEGLDIPEAEVVIWLRPTASLIIFLQGVGRVLRPIYAEGYSRLSSMADRVKGIALGKKPFAYIFDHVGNVFRHGLPDDERAWSLEGKKARKKAEGEVKPLSTCGECFTTFPSSKSHCPECGTPRTLTAREVQEKEGELEEITQLNRKQNMKREEWACKTLDDWLQLAEARGYKPTWAQIRWQHQQKRKSNSR